MTNKKQFKRLKRAESIDSGRRLEEMFSDEDDASRQAPMTAAREFDDFIEEDEFDDEEERETRAPVRSSRQSAVLSSQLAGIDEDKLGEIYEIFGDGDDYAWALAEENEFEEAEEEKKNALDLKDVFEPSELKARLLTEEDNSIRSLDVPERYQELRAGLKGKYMLNDSEFNDAVQFVVEKLKDMRRVRDLGDANPQAARKVMELINRDNLEVPFIWRHRRDHLADLTLEDLWRIVRLDIEYRGIVEKKRSVEKLMDLLSTYDSVYNEARQSAATLSAWQDLLQYVQFKYSKELREKAKNQEMYRLNVDDENEDANENENTENNENGKKPVVKKHSRFAKFERIKASKAQKIIEAFGMQAQEIGENMKASQRLNFSDDPRETPKELAKSLVGDDASEEAINQLLSDAQQLFVADIVHNPIIRSTLREQYMERAKINVVLNDKGRKKIGEIGPYADLKYAINRTPQYFREYPDVYLRMLMAESDGLLEARVMLSERDSPLDMVYGLFASDNVSDTAKLWNDFRKSILKQALSQLNKMVCRWMKETLRQSCMDEVFTMVRQSFSRKIDQAPFVPYGYSSGTLPRVLAISGGNCQFGQDAILCAFVDDDGQPKEFHKLGDPPSSEFKQKLLEIIKARDPDVIAIAGFTVNSNRLYEILRQFIEQENLVVENEDQKTTAPLPLVWVNDEVARVYQNAKGAEEFSDQPPLGRYCVALARYLQSPLYEYAALGMRELCSLHHHDLQHLLPAEMLELAIETAFVDIVNVVGVDINEAIRDTYLSHVVPYVCGLGPRKAQGMMQMIQSSLSGFLSNRAELITGGIVGRVVFINCAAFIKIPLDSNMSASSRMDEERSKEPLDATRVHPEDYPLARKMAADALDLDEEDLAQDESAVVTQLFNEGAEKVNDLVLEEYADELEKKLGHKKRFTLEAIRQELISPFGEQRRTLHILTPEDVFTMLTGETPSTLHTEMVVPVSIRRCTNRLVNVRLACGVEGFIGASNMTDRNDVAQPSSLFSFGQTVQALIIDLNYSKFTAELSTRERDIQDATARANRSRKPRDTHLWDFKAEEADKLAVAVEKQRKQARIIRHPLFRLLSSRQAEEYLAPMHRGDLVIRPSSRGNDHIAITWKVADTLFQHLDVVEVQSRSGTFGLPTTTLMVDGARYSDLDELIARHVQAMARKVDEMTASEKFRVGGRSETEKWLTAFTEASSSRSVYAFCFDHKHPGSFLLCFKTRSNTPVGTWRVRVIPNGFELMNNRYADVSSLCNGFKSIFTRMSQEQGRRR